MLELAKEIVKGKRLLRGDDTDCLLNADLQELCEGADYIRKELCKDRADLCAIINEKVVPAVKIVNSVHSRLIIQQPVKKVILSI